MYMRIATELPLKRLIVGGMERVYEVGRLRQINSSNRSVTRGSLGDRLASGDTSTGCMVIKVGCTSLLRRKGFKDF